MWQVPHPLSFTMWDLGISFMLLDQDVFFAPSSVVDSSNLSSPLLISIYSFPCRLKMAWKKKCPDDKKPQKPKGDHGGSSPLQADNQKLQGGNNAKVYQRNQEGWIYACTTWNEMSIQEWDCCQLWAQSELSIEADDGEGPVYGTCPWWCTKEQSVKCRYVSSNIDRSIWGRCRIMSNQ